MVLCKSVTDGYKIEDPLKWYHYVKNIEFEITTRLVVQCGEPNGSDCTLILGAATFKSVMLA